MALAAFALAVCFGVPSAHASSCLSYFEQSRPAIVNESENDFWARDLVTIGESKDYLTYSIDSELSLGDSLRFLLKDPKATAWLRADFEKVRFQKADLMRRLKIKSEAQFNRFALRREIDPKAKDFALTDLNPEFFHSAILALEQAPAEVRLTSYFLPRILRPFLRLGPGYLFLRKVRLNQIDAMMIGNRLAHLTDHSLAYENSELNAGIDGANVELRFRSFTAGPSNLRRTIESVHTRARFPMTHIHVGLPVSHFSHEQSSEIARSVEFDSILALAEDYGPNSRELKFTSFTTLDSTEAPKSEDRGIVRLGYSEFIEPVRSDNLEIRQYGDLKHGFALVQRISLLAKNVERLRITLIQAPRRIPDRITSNLPGALDYAGQVLMRSSDPKNQELAGQLRDFARRIYRDGEITPQIRNEIRDFLVKNQIRSRFTLDLFLE